MIRIALMLLAVSLSACALPEPDQTLVQICAMKPMGSQQGVMVVQLYCEPAGERV